VDTLPKGAGTDNTDGKCLTCGGPAAGRKKLCSTQCIERARKLLFEVSKAARAERERRRGADDADQGLVAEIARKADGRRRLGLPADVDVTSLVETARRREQANQQRAAYHKKTGPILKALRGCILGLTSLLEEETALADNEPTLLQQAASAYLGGPVPARGPSPSALQLKQARLFAGLAYREVEAFRLPFKRGRGRPRESALRDIAGALRGFGLGNGRTWEFLLSEGLEGPAEDEEAGKNRVAKRRRREGTKIPPK